MELRRWTLEPKKPILLSNIMDKPHQLSIVLYTRVRDKFCSKERELV